jgi:hypothetical protein
MKKILLIGSLLNVALTLLAANVTNLPAIADKPWVTNTVRQSSVIAGNTPTSGQVLLSSGDTNYWGNATATVTNNITAYIEALSGTHITANTVITNYNIKIATNIWCNTNTGIFYITNAGIYMCVEAIAAQGYGNANLALYVNGVDTDTLITTMTNSMWMPYVRVRLLSLPANSTLYTAFLRSATVTSPSVSVSLMRLY